MPNIRGIFSLKDIEDIITESFPNYDMKEQQAKRLLVCLNTITSDFLNVLLKQKNGPKHYHGMWELSELVEEIRYCLHGYSHKSDLLARPHEALKKQASSPRSGRLKHLALTLGEGNLDAGLHRLVNLDKELTDIGKAAWVLSDPGEFRYGRERSPSLAFGRDALIAVQDILKLPIRPGWRDDLGVPAGPSVRYLNALFTRLRAIVATDARLADLEGHRDLACGLHSFRNWIRDIKRYNIGRKKYSY